MFTSVRFQNFKGLQEYSISLGQINVLVGPNNAGKSSILDAFRTLSVALRYARRRNPTLLRSGSVTESGYEIPISSLPISLTNIHTDYRDDIETTIAFRLDTGNRVRLTFLENSRCVMTTETAGASPQNTNQFRRAFPTEIALFPTLGPLEEEETLLTDEYVQRWQGSRLTHRMFRNIWYRQPRDRFDEFAKLVETSWPGMRIVPPELHGYAPPRIDMFCIERRMTREVTWAGFGFQMWLQLLTHLLNAGPADMIIVDEPEIYLHPDLQRRLFHLLRASRKQIVLATHSAEIVNEAEHDEVVLINRSRRSARRVEDIEGLQEALFSIGSGQNIHLAKLSRGRKILFLEGLDFKLLRRFAGRLGLDALSNDVSLTVVPIGGFAQRQRIEHAAWTFQQVLRAEIAIAAVLDRDYRCDEEIVELINTVRESVPTFHVLGAKEIENYLLVPSAISRAVVARLRARSSESEVDSITEQFISDLLMESTEEMRFDVSAQLLTNRSRYYLQRTPSDASSITQRRSRDASSITRDMLERFEADWGNLERRLSIVPGKSALSELNRRLQQQLGVSITPPQIISHLRSDEISEALRVILVDLDTFAGSGPTDH